MTLFEFKKKYKDINESPYIDWVNRISFTVLYVLTVMHEQQYSYIDITYGLMLISIWLYYTGMRILSLIPIILGVWMYLLANLQ